MAELGIKNLINIGGRNFEPPQLKMLVVVVNRDKAELFASYLQDFDINVSFSLYAKGSSLKQNNGIVLSTPKMVILAAVREDKAQAVLDYLEDKFHSIKNGKGIAYTVPFNALVGVSSYGFLANIFD